LYLVERTIRFTRGFLLSYGPEAIKRRIWEEQYSGPKWEFRDHSSGDRLYGHLEEHARRGSILDLGCGSGNTAAELADSAYETYVGVDISEVALKKALRRTRECGRESKNRFVRADFLAWKPTPAEQFDVILFRESMYFVPVQKVKDTLERYSKYLRDGGVFIVGLYLANKQTRRDKSRPTAMLRIMETEFDVVERREIEHAARPTIIVFRPRQQDDVERAG
jgi:SAM-dependent methyltransferase